MSQSMINDFPDNILSHILSFLPTKDAFRTTVLSRRWPPLCYSLSVLQIDVYIHRERDISVPAARKWINFRQFLNAFLLSSRAQNHLTLKYFHLKCHQPVLDSSYFNNWIEAVNHRRVEELDLYLFKIRLEPSVVFCCKTLVILKLSQLYLLTMFRCPVDLPFLKTLHLYRVCFEEMEDFMKLLSACPLLEDLKTHYVQANAGVTAGGYFKPLANLINAEIRLFEVPFRALYNVKDLQIFELGRNLPHHGINSYYKSFPVFQNLTELRLSWLQGIHDWDEVVKMLQSSPILQTLTIVKMHRSPTKEDWTYPHHVPISVSSHLTTCTITDYQAVEADFWFATYILQNAGVLLNMTIRRTSYPEPTESPWYFDGLSSCPRISPACKLSLSKS